MRVNSDDREVHQRLLRWVQFGDSEIVIAPETRRRFRDGTGAKRFCTICENKGIRLITWRDEINSDDLALYRGYRLVRLQ